MKGAKLNAHCAETHPHICPPFIMRLRIRKRIKLVFGNLPDQIKDIAKKSKWLYVLCTHALVDYIWF